ncbi:MAG: DUF1232 domain-containing protein [Fimbriimonadales bacterium]
MIRNLIVPLKAKLMMLGALVYLVSPIDLIPDLLIGPGLLDDALVVPGLLLLAGRAIFEATARKRAAPPLQRINHNDPR